MDFDDAQMKKYASIYRRIGRSEEVLESWRQTEKLAGTFGTERGTFGAELFSTTGAFGAELLSTNAAYVLHAVADYLSLPAELRAEPAIQIEGLESLLGAALKPVETQSTENVTPAPDSSPHEEPDDSVPF